MVETLSKAGFLLAKDSAGKRALILDAGHQFRNRLSGGSPKWASS